jgi:hypothetical protein
MPFYRVTMRQIIEQQYYLEAADEKEAQMLAHEQDARQGTEQWYNDGDDGDVTTTVHEMSPEDIEEGNKWSRILSEAYHKYWNKGKTIDE